MATSANPLQGRRVVLGVTGGIAAYKAAELVRLLVKQDATVQVVMTEAAREFVGEVTFQALTGRRVFTDMFDLTQESEIGHIEAAEGADLVIIAPATANTIARLSAGLAGDPVSAVVLAARAPLLVAPAMNVNMWENPITQANVASLQARAGVTIVGPGSGFLACHWTGPGRLAEPADIVEAAQRLLTPSDLVGRSVVVSAGPTRESLDPVRFLSNRSSGKMGYAIARAAARRGATVKLVSGPVALAAPLGVEVGVAVSAADMDREVRQAAQGADVVVMAAAVADFRPAEPAANKLKKEEMPGAGGPGATGAEVRIRLERTTDILATLGRQRGERGEKRPLLVGFAAETEAVLENARAKLAKKGCDVVVANDVSQPDAGFAVDTNRVTIVTAEASEALDLASKDEVAHAILDRAAALLDAGV
jgi:phosphopantothenoylcysteine decarboxylase/phosphopantothenate--cysteine ligase